MTSRKNLVVNNRLSCTSFRVFETDHFNFWAATKANSQTKFEALLNEPVEACVPVKWTRITRAVVNGTKFWRFLFQSSETERNIIIFTAHCLNL